MSIFPLPMFEADADPSRRSVMSDAEIYARLKPPTSIVVRVGAMKHVAEYPYSGDLKPGCGSKLVARTSRGTEIVEMLTTTCANAGCAKSVSRNEMLEYIENSGGRDYPFHTEGQILRVATIDDLNAWARVQSETRERVATAKEIVEYSRLPMKVVELEPILGEELLTIYFLSEERVDFRELVRMLASEFHTRIEMRQVGARDEARLVADYERCGQHCCCKNFLKVLKPISMRSAKIQKATLDPLKISGRCGRLMCCLRYEDETYDELKKRLPKNKTRVGTSEGPGIVVDSKILVQLVLVQLEHDAREIAVPVEELLDPETCPKPGAVPATPPPEPDPLRGLAPDTTARRTDDRERAERGTRKRPEQQDKFREKSKSVERAAAPPSPPTPSVDEPIAAESQEPRKRRRRRRKKSGGARADGGPPTPDGIPRVVSPNSSDAPDSADGVDSIDESADAPAPPEVGANHGDAGGQASGGGGDRPKRRRRRRRRGGGDAGSGSSPPPQA